MCDCKIGMSKKKKSKVGALGKDALMKSLMRGATVGVGAIGTRELVKLIPASVTETITPIGQNLGVMVLGAALPEFFSGETATYVEGAGAGMIAVGALNLYDAMTAPKVGAIRTYAIQPINRNKVAGSDNRGTGAVGKVAGSDNRGTGAVGKKYFNAFSQDNNKFFGSNDVRTLMSKRAAFMG